MKEKARVVFPGPQVPAFFKYRLNRFIALVETGPEELLVHVPNSGRLVELLLPGASVYLTPRQGEKRKTAFDLTFAAVPAGKGWVCIDSRAANILLGQYFAGANILFPDSRLIGREVTLGKSRLDFLLGPWGNASVPGLLYVEAKCVTLVKTGKRAFFPDAPTARGRRHLEELTRLAKEGDRAAVVFLVQREDALSFSPNDSMDPAFGAALRQALSAGVAVRALVCSVTPGRLVLKQEIPVVI